MLCLGSIGWNLERRVFQGVHINCYQGNSGDKPPLNIPTHSGCDRRRMSESPHLMAIKNSFALLLRGVLRLRQIQDSGNVYFSPFGKEELEIFLSVAASSKGQPAPMACSSLLC
jgi:hypothetical protein